MKKILGLDLGTTSIGWALVQEAESAEERSSVIRIGVRVNPLTVDEQTNFDKGKTITTNADRTLKRSMRRNLQRYKLRRGHLMEILTQAGWISQTTGLSEQGPRTTFETLRLRAKASTEPISLEELARVLLMINKKRGYKSNRKMNNTEEEGQFIDGMEVAKLLQKHNLTPGQYACRLMSQQKNALPDFYRSDLLSEFNKVWECQRSFYPLILTDELKAQLQDKSKKQTWSICQKPFGIDGIKRAVKGAELQKENYQWRSRAVSEQLDLEILAIVLQEINGQLQSSSGYLGQIGDRSKELYFHNWTVGRYLLEKIEENPHFSLKNTVFYRQDYIDEFDRIWSVQARFHPELTEDLRKSIRNEVFYQRPLRSQKGLVSICELEGRTVQIETEGKTRRKLIGPKVCPKSSPLFQEFKIWQIINNLTVNRQPLLQEEREQLFDRLGTCNKMSKADVLKFLGYTRGAELNYKEVEGNRTQAALFQACAEIIEQSGHGHFDFGKMTCSEACSIIDEIFSTLGGKTGVLQFNLPAGATDLEQQPLFRLWHLLYSYEGDNSNSGNEKLIQKISDMTGLPGEYARILARVTLVPDYGSLSTRAIKKILPHLRDGNDYSVACAYAGYRHSKDSLTREEIATRILKDRLDILPRNSLRNPVVEKILNQMVHVVNAVIDQYGKPDEIRIELARELKKSAQERQAMTEAITKSGKIHEEIRKTLREEFGIDNPSRNDIVRYKLFDELKSNGYHTLYSNTYIPQEKLFSKEFDIEHIIPQARLFDDSFSNKTLEARQINIEKSNATAYDFVKAKYGEDGLQSYKNRVEELFQKGCIGKTKRNKLLMPFTEIPSDFIERDLRNTQYIAKKAKSMLEEIVRSVVPTTGAITDRLRQDWQLVDIMQELNWDKYYRCGLTTLVEDKNGRKIRKITDWTKRNDHRHHAMDALTIAFTKRSYIQYLNNLNARGQQETDDPAPDMSFFDGTTLPEERRTQAVRFIERTQLARDDNGKLRFIPPIPLNEFREVAREQLRQVLVSIKAKNKVVTRNINRTKRKGGTQQKVQLTPRGQLHNETVYGRIKRYAVKQEKVGPSFTSDKIKNVASPIYRAALLERLNQFGGDPKKAFSGKNSLDKSPLYLDAARLRTVPEKVALLSMENQYTIRQEVSPDLRLDKVIDEGVKQILQARLDAFGGDPKKAFADLDNNPIWLNEAKGICIKRVKIRGVNNAVSLHEQRDHNGKIIQDASGHPVPADFVSTSNNHHIAIFQDRDGNLQESVVPFYEAVARANLGHPVIDKTGKKAEGWEFLFTMKRNEYFVFPNPDTGFNPLEYDLTDPGNFAAISPNLFRVQKLATKYYVFRHHLETTVEDTKELQEVTWKRITAINKLKGIVKVRIDHIGRIVQTGEY